MTTARATGLFLVGMLLVPFHVQRLVADVGDPQLRTNHLWYPGELACSTFERLFATQAALYRRVTGDAPRTDEQKALASWMWRNINFWHGEDGKQDLCGKGFADGQNTNREYWTGLFAFGHAICGSTHAQWSAEMEYLLGHARARAVGVDGHTSFEVFLTGGAYGRGKWVLLDHDISTVIFNRRGTALLSIPEVKADLKQMTNPRFAVRRQHGWPLSGLHPGDAVGAFDRYDVAEYLPGYAAPPPMVHLRRGESLRRYPEPGLEDGRTFVYWGRNCNAGAIPGPERDRTWVNQPEKMYGSTEGTGSHQGQVRFANAVYVYRPDFISTDYREGVVEESDRHVTFDFETPYVIAATPPDNSEWGVYKSGCRNGLVLNGSTNCTVAVSVDCGKTWQECAPLHDGLDLTDYVKGYRQYRLRLGAGARHLADRHIVITTVCQANPCMMPRLADNVSEIHFAASNRALVSAGPTAAQARAHVIEGKLDTHRLTLELATPHQERVLEVYAAAHVASSSPPDPDVKYFIDYSTDAGRTWKPLVRDWSIPRRGDEPKDFWSQSFCYGSVELAGPSASSVRVRFRNSGGKNYLRVEAHLVYQTGKDNLEATFAWTDDQGRHQLAHQFGPTLADTWRFATGSHAHTRWVELANKSKTK